MCFLWQLYSHGILRFPASHVHRIFINGNTYIILVINIYSANTYIDIYLCISIHMLMYKRCERNIFAANIVFFVTLNHSPPKLEVLHYLDAAVRCWLVMKVESWVQIISQQLLVVGKPFVQRGFGGLTRDTPMCHDWWWPCVCGDDEEDEEDDDDDDDDDDHHKNAITPPYNTTLPNSVEHSPSSSP